MSLLAYRVTQPILVVVRDPDRYRLVQLAPGSVVYATGSKPDPNGMIDGTCLGDVVLMYSCDLAARAEPIPGETLSTLLESGRQEAVRLSARRPAEGDGE